MEILGLLQPFIIIYKEIKFFFDIFVYNPLIWVPKLHAPKIDKTVSKLVQKVPNHKSRPVQSYPELSENLDLYFCNNMEIRNANKGKKYSKQTNTYSDVSRVFLSRPVTSWSSPSPFLLPWFAEIFKPCASRCSKNALPGRACSQISL